MSQHIFYKNSKVNFSIQGKGSTVVLLHGFLENSTMWKDVISKLSKTNRVIAIDLLGHGQTDCLGYIHSMELMAEIVEAVLKSLKIRKATIVGHSMGGYVALAFAEKHPQKVKALCLMNSTAQEDNTARKLARTRANKLAQTNYKSMITMSVSNLFRPDNLPLFKEEIEDIKAEALKTPLQGYIACQEGMKLRPNRESVIKTDAFETLYIIGKDDPILDADSILKETKRVNTESIVLNGGHMSHIENKSELIQALEKFVRHS